MRSNPKFRADLVTFAEEILNEKLYFCAAILQPYLTSLMKLFMQKIVKRLKAVIYICKKAPSWVFDTFLSTSACCVVKIIGCLI